MVRADGGRPVSRHPRPGVPRWAGRTDATAGEFAYYPEPIWRKKLADWLIFLVGHGVYNINRARQRQDWPTATIYLGVTIKRVLETHVLTAPTPRTTSGSTAGSSACRASALTWSR